MVTIGRVAGASPAGRPSRGRAAAAVVSDPLCPRCGSALVVPALAGGPSEEVLQLRSGSAPAPARAAFDAWLCNACGHRWPHRPLTVEPPVDMDVAVPTAERGSVAREVPGDLVEVLDPLEPHDPEILASPHVAHALRQARQAHGLTLADAAKVTRIQVRYLRALEDNAPLQEFPAPAYARAFLRAYVEFLGLEPEGMVREFDESHPVEPEPLLRPIPDGGPRRRVLAGFLVVVSIASLVALAVLALDRDDRSEPGIALPPPASQEGPVGRSDVTRPPPESVLHDVRAVLTFADRSWIEAAADGEELEGGRIFEAGERVVYRADRVLELLFGDAGAVELTVAGERIATGGPGDVVELTLRIRDGELVVKGL